VAERGCDQLTRDAMVAIIAFRKHRHTKLRRLVRVRGCVCHPPARRLLSQAIKGGGAKAKRRTQRESKSNFRSVFLCSLLAR
jgi:hypothetical protein